MGPSQLLWLVTAVIGEPICAQDPVTDIGALTSSPTVTVAKRIALIVDKLVDGTLVGAITSL